MNIREFVAGLVAPAAYTTQHDFSSHALLIKRSLELFRPNPFRQGTPAKLHKRDRQAERLAAKHAFEAGWERTNLRPVYKSLPVYQVENTPEGFYVVSATDMVSGSYTAGPYKARKTANRKLRELQAA